MKENKRNRIRIDRKSEARTSEISNMIGEGGLGADEYYEIVKLDEAQHMAEQERQ